MSKLSRTIEMELKKVIDETKKDKLLPSEIIKKYKERIINDLEKIFDFENVIR